MMALSGKINGVPGDQSQLRQILASFVESGYEVSPSKPGYLIEGQALDAWIGSASPLLARHSWLRATHDRIRIWRESDGAIHYRIAYWSPFQLATHAAITLLLLADLLLSPGSARGPAENFLLAALLHSIPPLVFQLSHLRSLRILERARPT